MSANARQIGGTHYKTAKEHWDWAEENGLGYLEAYATKYVTRARKSGGVQSLEKALHCLEKLMELRFTLGRSNRAYPTDPRRARGVDEAFGAANGLTAQETHACHLLARWTTRSDLETVRTLLNAMIVEMRRGKNPA